ncbi:agmatinase [Leucosporidium creatinivorum]|uniref:agmatinase n=1 Tax=Leucosporidium creatinivorum TaxID=106004 RepID=A0A1Y2EUR5_9BASI|nr:agmatinase [Leucosporidium creatinivorum]
MLGTALTALAALGSLASAAPQWGDHHLEHDGHSHGQEQIPLGYVKFPTQFSEPIFYKNGQGHEKGAFIPGDGEPQAEAIFSGIGTFAHLPYAECFKKDSESFDIAFLGLPFDTGTSYRPGARFGPAGIRQGSRRLTLYGGYNVALDVNPFRSWAKLVDCGDVAVTPYDSAFAIKQMERGHLSLLSKPVHTQPHSKNRNGELVPAVGLGKGGVVPPRIISMGGDHTVVLPILRSINAVYGPISVIHFDSHLDTWNPSVFGGSPSETASINHGTYFWHAAQEGLIANGTSIHAGIRTTLSGPSDYQTDAECGFQLSEAREIDTIGTEGIIKRIRDTVGTNPVYLSIDIDVLDPSAAPATGTPETGGWSTRELRTIIRGLEGLKLVGADVVEVATPYDSQAELTVQAAADVLSEVLGIFVKAGPLVAK